MSSSGSEDRIRSVSSVFSRVEGESVPVSRIALCLGAKS